MIITSKFDMDFALQLAPIHVKAVQDDKYSRNIEISLYAGGAAWEPPAGTAVVVYFAKPDNKGGLYSILPDGTQAYSISGNTLTIGVAPQVLTVPGLVRLSISLRKGKIEISTFIIHIDVQAKPGANLVSENYINVNGLLHSYGWSPDMYLGTDLNGNVIERRGMAGSVEPTSYLIGGKEFLPMPEWDKKKYPNAYMLEDQMGTYTLLVTDTAAVAIYDNENENKLGIYVDNEVVDGAVVQHYFMEWTYVGPTSGWVASIDESYYASFSRWYLIWTNTNTRDADGKLAMYATQPIAVYAQLLYAVGWSANKYLATDANGYVVEADAPSGGGATKEQLAQIQENADAIAASPVVVAPDGYTDIAGLRQATYIKIAEGETGYTVESHLQGDVIITTTITNDADGYPVLINDNGHDTVLEWVTADA